MASWRRAALRTAVALVAVIAAASAWVVCTFRYPPHGRQLPDGRIEVDWSAKPELPPTLQAYNYLVQRWVDWVAPLDPERIIVAAQRRTGLSDFGNESYREGLDRFMASSADFTPFWRTGTVEMATEFLSTRLRVVQMVKEHPEILDERVDAPLVIVGLPRTGTSHLYSVLAAHPDLRPLPMWEAMSPVEPAGLFDVRGLHARMKVIVQNWFAPLFHIMHEVSAYRPHEDIHLFNPSFTSWMLEMWTSHPAYGEWYENSADLGGAYREFRVMLQLLQWQDRRRDPAGYVPRRWLLKTPMHSERYEALLGAFPDAHIVATHRDPLPVMKSFLTLVAYAGMGGGDSDAVRIAKYWAPRLERMLRRSVDGRVHVPPAQLHDVLFTDFVADNFGVARAVCADAAAPVTAAAAAAMQRVITSRKRGKDGTVRYSLQHWGMDDATVSQQFGFYREHFGITEEGRRAGREEALAARNCSAPSAVALEAGGGGDVVATLPAEVAGNSTAPARRNRTAVSVDEESRHKVATRTRRERLTGPATVTASSS